jgi:DNA polymerase bacteriophage-type
MMTTPKRLWLDFETSSELDIEKVQQDLYLRHESTRALMLAYAYDDGPVELVEGETLPQHLIDALEDPTVQKLAWNCGFEIGVLLHRFQIESRYGEWHDPMIRARYLTFPAKLEYCAPALGLTVQKDKRGKALIRKFCTPSMPTKPMLKKGCKPGPYLKDKTTDPEDWEIFKRYCCGDVSVMREALQVMDTYPAMPAREWNHWRLSEMINQTGKPVDLTFVQNAHAIVLKAKAATLVEFKTLTGLKNPNSIKQLSGWLAKRQYPMESLAKEFVDDALLGLLPGPVRAALEMRQKLAGSATDKLPKILDSVSPDGRLRNLFGFYVGHLGRWAGKGAQTQNLAKPDRSVKKRIPEITDSVRLLGTVPEDLDPILAITSTMRSSFRAIEGHEIVVSDFSSVESRVLGWLARCPALLAVYREGRCAYRDFATRLNCIPYAQVSDELRIQAKPAVLGCGYQMSAGGLAAYAKKMGILMTEEEAAEHVATFRAGYPEIPELWGTFEKTAVAAVRDRAHYIANGITFDGRDPRFLRVGLPSERDLFYLQPTLKTVKRPGRPKSPLAYWASKGGPLMLTETFGGKLTENITQALARDLLCQALLLAYNLGYKIIGHVHDEVVCEQLIGSPHNVATLEEIMSRSPRWAPDLMMKAEGKASAFYQK